MPQYQQVSGAGYTPSNSTNWQGGVSWSNVRFTISLAPPDDGLAGARAVLGVEPDAPPDVIRKAYRAKLMETHPDHGGSEEAVRRVISAYRRLT